MEAYAIMIVIYLVMAGINAVRKSGNGGKRGTGRPAAGRARQSQPMAQGRPAQTLPVQGPKGEGLPPQSQGRPAAGARRGQPLPGPAMPGQFVSNEDRMGPAASPQRSSRPAPGQPPRQGSQGGRQAAAAQGSAQGRRPGLQGAVNPTAGRAGFSAVKPSIDLPASQEGPTHEETIDHMYGLDRCANAVAQVHRHKEKDGSDLLQGMIWSQILGEPRSRQLHYGRAGRRN